MISKLMNHFSAFVKYLEKHLPVDSLADNNNNKNQKIQFNKSVIDWSTVHEYVSKDIASNNEDDKN